MRKGLLAVLLLLHFGGKSTAQTTIVDSFRSDGIWRSYRLYIPANYTTGTARPLILNMHGLGSNSLEQQGYSNFMPIADTAGFLMAYPQGLSANGTTYWNVGIPLTAGTNDIKFLSALIDTISSRYSIDHYRVYATGMSLGGYMSHYLALKLNTRIAAIASVTGTIYPDVYATAAPGRAVPMMQVHGTADPTVPYNGNATGIAIDTLVAFWVKNNRCNPVPVHTALPDINTSDNSTATHDVYTGGTNGATCEFYKIAGGEHTWPGSPYIIGVTNQDFSASVEIWRFFREYRLSQFLGISPVIPAARARFYPNPCTDVLHTDKDLKNGMILTDLTGREIMKAYGSAMDIRPLAAGTYFIRYQMDGNTMVDKIVKQ